MLGGGACKVILQAMMSMREAIILYLITPKIKLNGIWLGINILTMKKLNIKRSHKEMKLNREQIIKALECCYDNDKSCLTCPFIESSKFESCVNLNKSVLSLIKELTEENERLRERNIVLKATTGYDLIDQIAKEMLEGKE